MFNVDLETGTLILQLYSLAEGVGFEPTELSFNGFQDRRLKPLGHPSESLADLFLSSHVGPEHFGNKHRSVCLLEIFQDSYDSSANGKP
jgi:hypothetical protein